MLKWENVNVVYGNEMGHQISNKIWLTLSTRIVTNTRYNNNNNINEQAKCNNKTIKIATKA